MRAVSLTTEEEGVAMLAGAWLGGQRGVLLLQSSGVGNCINMLALNQECRIPLLALVTMRGEWGEFNPWQVPMGRRDRGDPGRAGVLVYRADAADDVAPTVRAAAARVPLLPRGGGAHRPARHRHEELREMTAPLDRRAATARCSATAAMRCRHRPRQSHLRRGRGRRHPAQFLLLGGDGRGGHGRARLGPRPAAPARARGDRRRRDADGPRIARDHRRGAAVEPRLVVLDNEHYGETGMQVAHTGRGVDLAGIAAATGFKLAVTVRTEAELESLAPQLFTAEGPLFAAVKVSTSPSPTSLPAARRRLPAQPLSRSIPGPRCSPLSCPRPRGRYISPAPES